MKPSTGTIWREQLTENEVILRPFVVARSSWSDSLTALFPSLKQPCENPDVVRLIRSLLWMECVMSSWGYAPTIHYSSGKTVHPPQPLTISNRLIILRVIGQLYLSPPFLRPLEPSALLPMNYLMIPSVDFTIDWWWYSRSSGLIFTVWTWIFLSMCLAGWPCLGLVWVIGEYCYCRWN